MKLLYAAFLIIGLGSLVQGEVMEVEDVKKKCSHFFVDEQPPIFSGKFIPDDNRARYRFICQTQEKDYEYVTLYDTINRIPVYSAYKYYKRKPGTKNPSKTTWKIEPQLDRGDKPYMTTEAKSEVKGLGENQAVNKDYEGSDYDKGHLYPVNHAHNQDAADATFTLTNAAPQLHEFNTAWYNKVEKVVSEELDKCPDGNAYVVTGVMPGGKKMKGRVNVPFEFWTAYCCKDNFSYSYMMSEKLELKHGNLRDFQDHTKIQPFGGKCV